MELTDRRIKRAMNAIRQRKKHFTHSFLGVGKRAMSKRQFAALQQQQQRCIMQTILPPLVGINSNINTQQMLVAATNRHVEFTDADIDKLLYYLDSLVEIFKLPNTSEQQRNDAFIRIAGIAYLVETLNTVLVERDAIVLDDKLNSQLKSHTAALMNFINDVSERRQLTGKWALSGSNVREIDEFTAMAKGMLKVLYISEWYTAYAIVLYRFIANRMGCEIKDYV